jgi:hypothetical protein
MSSCTFVRISTLALASAALLACSSAPSAAASAPDAAPVIVGAPKGDGGGDDAPPVTGGDDAGVGDDAAELADEGTAADASDAGDAAPAPPVDAGPSFAWSCSAGAYGAFAFCGPPPPPGGYVFEEIACGTQTGHNPIADPVTWTCPTSPTPPCPGACSVLLDDPAAGGTGENWYPGTVVHN